MRVEHPQLYGLNINCDLIEDPIVIQPKSTASTVFNKQCWKSAYIACRVPMPDIRKPENNT
jgi:hypothetical protein